MLGLVAAVACDGGAKAQPAPAGTGSATAAASAPIASGTPVETPTPKPPVPADVAGARAGVEKALMSNAGELCPRALLSDWNVGCVLGDVDGDGKTDAAYLVPLDPPARVSPAPAVVFVFRSGAKSLDQLRLQDDADASRVGQGFFGITSLPGAASVNQVTALSAACTAGGCTYHVHVQAFDGSAWREAGPVDGFDSLDRVGIRTSPAPAALNVHTAPALQVAAGPTRAVSWTFLFDGRRFMPESRTPDPASYLFSAIEDADALFDRARLGTGEWSAAVAAYKEAAGNPGLKDWQHEVRGRDGRAGLEAYALFRIAVAVAASGEDPTAAIDAVIRDAKDPLFAYAAEQFRAGFLDHMSVHSGCLAATKYLAIVTADADNPAHVREVFDYGYANLPVRSFGDICPL